MLNYGNLDQWRWVLGTYGRDGLQDAVAGMQATEFKTDALRLAPLLLGAVLNRGAATPIDMPPDFDFSDSYDQDLFRGYIESEETARHILKALCISIPPRYTNLQRIGRDKDNKLLCGAIDDPHFAPEPQAAGAPFSA